MSTSTDTIFFVVPGDINTRTGGYLYDKKILEGLRQRGHDVELISLPGDYPQPTAQQLEQASSLLANIPDQAITIIDGLAFSTMPELAATQQQRLRLVALIHHPLALETGNTRVQADRFKQSEQQALRYARRVITTSPATSQSLIQDYEVPEARIATVCPGTDSAPLATGSIIESGNLQNRRLDSNDSPPGTNLLCVATLTQRKGHGVLLDALASLKDIPWTLSCAGSLERDKPVAQSLFEKTQQLQLTERVNFLGELDDKALQVCYQKADLFVLASFHEGYGMVLDEAIARGLPIIASNAGAIPQTVPSGAGLLFPSGDALALAGALRQFMQDAATRDSLRTAARLARSKLPSWQHACTQFEAALQW